MTAIEIRRLRPGDRIDEAAELLVRFFAEEGFDTPADLIRRRTAEMAAIDACALMVAEARGSAIAVVTASLEFGIEFGWSAEMGDLYVVPEWRGRGVSRKLIDALERLLVDHGASGYQVTVTPTGQDHHDLRSYYAKLGFSGEGRLILHKQL